MIQYHACRHYRCILGIIDFVVSCVSLFDTGKLASNGLPIMSYKGKFSSTHYFILSRLITASWKMYTQQSHGDVNYCK